MAFRPEEELKDLQANIEHKANLPSRLLLKAFMKAESTRRGVSLEDVRKNKLQEVTKNLQGEATSNILQFGVIERGSPAFQSFLTAIHAIFTPEQLQQFRKNARLRSQDARVINGLRVLSARELKDSRDFFENKFKGYKRKEDRAEKNKKDAPKKEESIVPSAEILKEHALELQKMRLAIERLLSEVDLQVGSRGDLRSIIRRHPEAGADIGIILLTRELLDKIERTQEVRVGGQRTLQAMGRSIQEDISALFTKDLDASAKLIKNALGLPKKNAFWGSLAVAASFPAGIVFPVLRAVFIIPKALAIGAKDAFVLTGRGNERPKK